MEFRIIDNKAIDEINAILRDTDYNGCEYQYSYMRAWVSREPNCLLYAIENDIAYVMFKCNYMPIMRGERLFLPPLTTDNRIPEAYNVLLEYCRSIGEELKVIAAPLAHVDSLDKGVFACDKIANADEYLYNTRDLLDLPGKKYHSKRNHIAKFNRQYDYEFRDYQSSDYKAVWELYTKWQSLSLEYESREEYAIQHMLDNREQYGIRAGVLLVGGKIIALTMCEVTANRRGIVHFEKADTSYDGAYAVINNEGVKKYLSNTIIINRQEDMGIEGLRKSKLSYYPIGYCEKWIVKAR